MTYLLKQCFRYVYDIHVACTASIQLLFMHSFLQLADNEGNTNVYGQCQIIDPVAMFHLVDHKPIIHVHLHALDSDVKFVCCAAINAPWIRQEQSPQCRVQPPHHRSIVERVDDVNHLCSAWAGAKLLAIQWILVPGQAHGFAICSVQGRPESQGHWEW